MAWLVDQQKALSALAVPMVCCTWSHDPNLAFLVGFWFTVSRVIACKCRTRRELLNCINHLATILIAQWNWKRSYLKGFLLFFVCMSSYIHLGRFHPHPRHPTLPVIILTTLVSSPPVGEINFIGFSSLCVLCYMSICVRSLYFHSILFWAILQVIMSGSV